jgi:hypothetical protein
MLHGIETEIGQVSRFGMIEDADDAAHVRCLSPLPAIALKRRQTA